MLFMDNLFKSGADLGPGGGARESLSHTVLGSDPRSHLGASPKRQESGSVQVTEQVDRRLKEVVTGTSVTSTAP